VREVLRTSIEIEDLIKLVFHKVWGRIQGLRPWIGWIYEVGATGQTGFTGSSVAVGRSL